MTLQLNYKLAVLHHVLKVLDQVFTDKLRDELDMPEILDLEVAIVNKIRTLEATQ